MNLLAPTRRVSLTLGGAVYDEWTRVEIVRDLSDISGSFQLELRDSIRSIASWPFASLAPLARKVTLLDAVTIAIDEETVLAGYIEEIAPRADASGVSIAISGRDKTGDLIDGAASVDGPFEYDDIPLDSFCTKICEPYGLRVRAEVDIGEPIERATIDVAETGLSGLEKYARQRGLLVTSDGIDSVVLTRSGHARAPGSIVFPSYGVISASGCFSSRGRHDAYHVKGQAERAGGKRKGKTAHLDATAEPLTGATPDGYVSGLAEHEEAGTAIHATARDPQVRRHRPHVALGRTKLTQKGAQTQADWMARTARAKEEKLEYEVKDFRANGELWRPNTMVPVDDSFNDVNKDMLIAGVAYRYDEQGVRTLLRLTGPDAYDPGQERKGDHKGTRKGKGKGKGGDALDTTAEGL